MALIPSVTAGKLILGHIFPQVKNHISGIQRFPKTKPNPSILPSLFQLHRKQHYSTAPDKPRTTRQQLKKAIAEYGATVIVFHVSISLVSLGLCYFLVSTGLDVRELLISLKLENWVNSNPTLVSNAGTFAVAYAIHKVFAPVRLGITMGCVPFIVKYLRSKHILKK